MKIASLGPLIYIVRGHRVMLDSDLARLYGVTTGNLNKSVSRNASRFPSDFMFKLNAIETRSLIFQSGISTARRRGGRRFFPRAFTEQGVAMLSSVLRSQRAVDVNIEIMRAFVRLRQILATNKELAQRLKRVEREVGWQDRRLTGQTEQIEEIFAALHRLLAPPVSEKRRIGFRPPGE